RTYCNHKKLKWLHPLQQYRGCRFKQTRTGDHVGYRTPEVPLVTDMQTEGCKYFHRPLHRRETCDRLLRVVPVAPLPSWRQLTLASPERTSSLHFLAPGNLGWRRTYSFFPTSDQFDFRTCGHSRRWRAYAARSRFWGGNYSGTRRR